MDGTDYEIKYPILTCEPDQDKEKCRLDQDEEWIVLTDEGRSEKIRLHEYEKFYKVPGLYEEVLYDHLKCNSPRTVCTMLREEMEKSDEMTAKLRILDFGAGNGMVGECLKETIGYETLVGVDIIRGALDAAHRDRPGLYDNYYVMDFSQLATREKQQIDKWDFNTLITVAALGYNHIGTRAFVNAFNLLDDDAWIAFNIKDRFLSSKDDSGFKKILDAMMGDSLSVLQKKRYRHRLSLAGDPLYYYAIVGKKDKEVRLP